MTTVQDKQIVKRFFAELCNGRKMSIAEEILDPGVVMHEPASVGGGERKGIAAVTREVGIYHTGFPNAEWVVADIVSVEDGRVLAIWKGKGTHKGQLPGFAPTGKRVEVNAMTLFTLRNGRITAIEDNWDVAAMLQQIGAIPSA